MSWITDQLVSNRHLEAVCASSDAGHVITADPKDHVQSSVSVLVFTEESCKHDDSSSISGLRVHNGIRVLFLATKIMFSDPCPPACLQVDRASVTVAGL